MPAFRKTSPTQKYYDCLFLAELRRSKSGWVCIGIGGGFQIGKPGGFAIGISGGFHRNAQIGIN
jgi:hypothetical protein